LQTNKAARSSLPIVGEEQQIMESIVANDVFILVGEAGSAKQRKSRSFYTKQDLEILCIHFILA
jgi:HrpA-like RNA helicase